MSTFIVRIKPDRAEFKFEADQCDFDDQGSFILRMNKEIVAILPRDNISFIEVEGTKNET